MSRLPIQIEQGCQYREDDFPPDEEEGEPENPYLPPPGHDLDLDDWLLEEDSSEDEIQVPIGVEPADPFNLLESPPDILREHANAVCTCRADRLAELAQDDFVEWIKYKCRSKRVEGTTRAVVIYSSLDGVQLGGYSPPLGIQQGFTYLCLCKLQNLQKQWVLQKINRSFRLVVAAGYFCQLVKATASKHVQAFYVSNRVHNCAEKSSGPDSSIPSLEKLCQLACLSTGWGYSFLKVPEERQTLITHPILDFPPLHTRNFFLSSMDAQWQEWANEDGNMPTCEWPNKHCAKFTGYTPPPAQGT